MRKVFVTLKYSGDAEQHPMGPNEAPQLTDDSVSKPWPFPSLPSLAAHCHTSPSAVIPDHCGVPDGRAPQGVFLTENIYDKEPRVGSSTELIILFKASRALILSNRPIHFLKLRNQYSISERLFRIGMLALAERCPKTRGRF